MSVEDGLTALKVAGAVGQIQSNILNQDIKRDAFEEEKGLREDYDYFASKMQEGADLSVLQGDPRLQTGRGYRAAVMLSKDRAQMGENNLQIAQKATALAQENYQNRFRPLMFAATEAYERGDMQAFGQYAAAASDAAPMPYKVQVGADGNLVEMFRSTQAGGFTPTGRSYTAQQAYENLKKLGMGEQMVLQGATMQTTPMNRAFLSQAAQFMMGTRRDNEENAINPSKRLQLNNGKYYAIAQNRLDNYSGETDFLIFDTASDRQVGSVSGAAGLRDNGFTVTGTGIYKPPTGRGRGRGDTRGGLDAGGASVTSLQDTKPGTPIGNAISRLGYTYDSNNKQWYSSSVGMDGTVTADLTKPITEDVLVGIMQGLQPQTAQGVDGIQGTAPEVSVGGRTVQQGDALQDVPVSQPVIQTQQSSPVQQGNSVAPQLPPEGPIPWNGQNAQGSAQSQPVRQGVQGITASPNINLSQRIAMHGYKEENGWYYKDGKPLTEASLNAIAQGSYSTSTGSDGGDNTQPQRTYITASGSYDVSPGTPLGQQLAMMQDVMYNEDTQWWYYTATNMDGETVPDTGKPVSREAIETLIQGNTTAQQGSVNLQDPRGYKVRTGQEPVQNNVETSDGLSNTPSSPPQPTPQQPKRRTGVDDVLDGMGKPTPQSANTQASGTGNATGRLVQYNDNGVTRFAVIDENGNPRPLSAQEAVEYAKKVREERPRLYERAVTYNDVEKELSQEEKDSWRKTGKLPERYKQAGMLRSSNSRGDVNTPKWYTEYNKNKNKPWKPTKLTPQEEARFKKDIMELEWFGEMKAIYKKNNPKMSDDEIFRDLTHKDGDFDYRRAWRQGIRPEFYAPDGTHHWSSRDKNGEMLKRSNHSTAWKEFFMNETGIDPIELGLKTVEDAIKWSKNQGR